MKALLDYSKIEKYIIYNDMTKARFAKMQEFPTQHSKTLKTKKALPSQAHKKSPPPFTQIFYRLSKKNKIHRFPSKLSY